MTATTMLHLPGGIVRTVKGRHQEVDAILKPRTLGADNGLRTFITPDGEQITVNTAAVLLAEPDKTTTRNPIGFR